MKHDYTSLSRRNFLTGMAGFAALNVMAAAFPHQACAVTAAEKQAEAEAAYASLVDMQQQLDIASNDYTEALFALEEAQKRMDECQIQINEKTVEIEGLQDRLCTRVRNMYRSGGNHFLEVFVGSTSFEEFVTNMDLLDDLNESDALLVAQTKAARADLESAREEYSEQERIAQEKADEAAAIEAEAESTLAQMQAVYDSLSAEAAELLEQERKAAEEEAARQAAAVVAASAAAGGEYEASAENRAFNESNSANGGEGDATEGEGVDEEPVEADVEAEDENDSDNESVTDEEPTEEDGAEEVVEEEAADDESAYVDESADGGGGEGDGSEQAYEGGSDTVSRAYACLGAPYSWGAVGPGSYDCSGLVSYCLTGSHTRLGTTGTFMGWSQVSDPQPGDVCTSSYHCGIYIGDGQMIHAADYGIGVIIGPVQSDMIIVRW